MTGTRDAGDVLDRSIHNVQRLAVLHLARYRVRLERARQGAPGYRLAELERLVWIWERVVAVGCQYDLLDPEERVEVDDAIEDDADSRGLR